MQRAQSRKVDKKILPDRQQWLALNVTAHKTRAIGQVDGYTILLQNATPLRIDVTDAVNNDIHRENDAIAVANRGPNMPGLQDETSSTGRLTPRIGLQHYMCAEYIDSLT
jgi:hypothetical protein